MRSQQPVNVRLRIAGHGVSNEQRDSGARQLRRNIVHLPVDDVRVGAPSKSALEQPGAKGDLLVAGSLIVTMLTSRPLVSALADVVASWLARQASDVEVEINGHHFKGRVSGQERAELLAAITGCAAHRHSDPPASEAPAQPSPLGAEEGDEP